EGCKKEDNNIDKHNISISIHRTIIKVNKVFIFLVLISRSYNYKKLSNSTMWWWGTILIVSIKIEPELQNVKI
ncbi:hypothetical protein, partial [Myroides marinus]|uniref:hypothetical protein n=1 Tax=Myroides marinus TaxID=703342 RepID=UPI002574D0C6